MIKKLKERERERKRDKTCQLIVFFREANNDRSAFYKSILKFTISFLLIYC